MNLPRDFLRYENFELAFTRIVRGGNKEYKAFYRHLFPSFNLALRENLKDLIEELKHGTFEPERPTVRAAGKIFAMESVAKTLRKNHSTNCQFWRGILALNRLHCSPSEFRRLHGSNPSDRR